MTSPRPLNEGLLQRIIAGRSPEDLARLRREVRNIRTESDRERVIEEAEGMAADAESWAENLRAYLTRNFAALPAAPAAILGSAVGGPVGAAAGLAAVAVAGAAFSYALPRGVVETERRHLAAFAQNMRAVADQARQTKVIKEMKDYLTEDTAGRSRTYADRRAFVLAESTEQAVAAMREQQAPKAAPAPTGDFLAPGRMGRAAKERAALRESGAEARRAAFLRALAEAVYLALPMDEHEKAPHRAVVMEQVEQLASAVSGWQLSGAGEELVEQAGLLATGTADEARAAVSAAAADPTSELGAALREAAAEIEGRVVAAVLDSQQRAAVLENALTEGAGEDPELSALRARRAAKRHSQTLVEALFVANRQALTEGADRELPADLVLAEAVAQYTLLETLSAYGVARVEDPQELVRRLAAAKH